MRDVGKKKILLVGVLIVAVAVASISLVLIMMAALPEGDDTSVEDTTKPP